MSLNEPHLYMDLYKQFYDLLRSKIQFKTAEGEYIGVIEHIVPTSQLVMFEHVYFVPTGEYAGSLNFYLREFLAYKVLDCSEEFRNPVKWEYLSNIINRQYPKISFRLNDLFDGELDEEESDEDAPYPEDYFKDDFVLNLPPHLQNELPHDNLILETIDREFYQAIEYISRQNVIGVSFEGPKISRLGVLSWVCISTPLCVFLFDIELLKISAFDNGLRDIFQSKNIEKVIHDCREPSDCLSHLFNTKLVNVFDTQAADYLVNKQRYSDKPVFKHVSSLDCCIVSHLGVPQEFISNRETNLSYHCEITFFQMRPISNDYRHVVIKNAVYLVLLKKKLAELMMTPFKNAVDVYLNVLANASEPELLLDPSVPDILPPALVMQGIKTVCFHEVPIDTPPVPLVCKFKDPIKGTIIEPEKSFEIDTKKVILRSTVISNNLDKSKKCSEQNADKSVSRDGWKVLKHPLNSKHVIVQSENLMNSMKHMDNLYHKLVNGCSISKHIDVKPSRDSVCNFIVKQPFLTMTTEEKTLEDKSFSSDAVLDSSSKSSSGGMADSNTWSRLRAAFGVSEKTSDYSNVRFIPAGM